MEIWFYVLFPPSGCSHYINKYICLSPGFARYIGSNCDCIVFFSITVFMKILVVTSGPIHACTLMHLHTCAPTCTHIHGNKQKTLVKARMECLVRLMAGKAWQQEPEVHCYIVLTVKKQSKLNVSFIGFSTLHPKAHGRMQPTFRMG